MFDFKNVRSMQIPNGNVVGISANGLDIWDIGGECNLVYKHSNNSDLSDSGNTGHIDCYALYVGNETSPKPKFGTFADSKPITYRVKLGTPIRVVVSNYNPTEYTYDDVDCNIYLNNSLVKSGYRGTEYTFTITGDTVVDFMFKTSGDLLTVDRKEWEDCYITVNDTQTSMALDSGVLDTTKFTETEA